MAIASLMAKWILFLVTFVQPTVLCGGYLDFEDGVSSSEQHLVADKGWWLAETLVRLSDGFRPGLLGLDLAATGGNGVGSDNLKMVKNRFRGGRTSVGVTADNCTVLFRSVFVGEADGWEGLLRSDLWRCYAAPMYGGGGGDLEFGGCIPTDKDGRGGSTIVG